MRNLSIAQVVICCVSLAGITLLGMFDKVSSDALIAIYSAVIGGAIGYVNGQKASLNKMESRVSKLEAPVEAMANELIEKEA